MYGPKFGEQHRSVLYIFMSDPLSPTNPNSYLTLALSPSSLYESISIKFTYFWTWKESPSATNVVVVVVVVVVVALSDFRKFPKALSMRNRS